MPKIPKIEDVISFRNDSSGEKISDIFIMDTISKWWGESLPAIKDLVLEEKPTKINLHIVNCPGGDVGEALAIKGFIKDYPVPVKTIITGFVASAATIIAMAGDEVVMKEDALWLVHNASIGVWGNKEEIKKTLEDLETVDNLVASIYSKHTGMSRSDVANLMNENKWITAEEAKAFGFIDKVVEKVNIAANIEVPTKEDFKNWNLKYPYQLDKNTNNKNSFDDMKNEIKNIMLGFVNEIKSFVVKNSEKEKEKEPEDPKDGVKEEGAGVGATEGATEGVTPTETEGVNTEIMEEELVTAIQGLEQQVADGNISKEKYDSFKNKFNDTLSELKALRGGKSGGISNNETMPIAVENSKSDSEQKNANALKAMVKRAKIG